MGDKSQLRNMKSWDNGLKTWDLSAEWVKKNPDLCKNFGKDRVSYDPESRGLSAQFWSYNEAGIAHGYPATAWLQLGLLYAVGLHTAKEQGIVAKGTLFSRYWRAHYFDWITFARRGFVYAWAGGLLGGIIMFGSPDLTFKRAVSKYHYAFSKPELRHSEQLSTLMVALN